MTTKRFVAPDMRRALDLVREEMGPDAIILSSQRTAQGVEIITSTDIDLPTRGIEQRQAFSQRFDAELDQPLASDQAWQNQQEVARAARQYRTEQPQKPRNQMRSEELAGEIEAARQRMLAAKEQRDTPSAAAPKRAPSAEAKSAHQIGLDRQMAGLEEQVRSRAAAQQEVDNRQLSALQHELADMRLLLEQQLWRQREQQSPAAQPQLSLAAEALSSHLNHLGLPEALVKKLTVCATPGKHLNAAWREALGHLARQLPTVEGDQIARGGIFAFVGPTGVGKTTTIAKLASRFVLEHGLGKVALVTTDTYRVGAHDQLRALGRILNVPVRVVDQERGLPSVVASLQNFPVVLIDTAGFRQGDPLLKEQEAMLDSCPGIKRLLVLACNSQLQSLKASTHAYSKGRLSGCVLTKVDETASLGEALGVIAQRQLPIWYSSDGQGIPKDIQPGSAHKLVAKAVALMKRQQQLQRAHSGVR